MTTQLYILAGAPGVGKSTWIAKQNDGVVLSSDAIRYEIYGHLLDQSDHQKVFRVMNQRLKDAIQKNTPVIYYDATNLNRRRRSHLYREVNAWGDVEVTIVYLLKPLQEILHQNNQRVGDKRVPEEVVINMYRNQQPPRLGVDCDRMLVEGSFKDFQDEINQYIDEPHYSPYHAETIREHINMTIENATTPQLKEIATYHDLGKSVCRAPEESPKPSAQYIRDTLGVFYRYKGHENVGAMYYLAHMNDIGKVDSEWHLQVIESIFQHMNAHQGLSTKTIRRNLLTQEDIELINQFQKVDTVSKIKDDTIYTTYKQIQQQEREG